MSDAALPIEVGIKNVVEQLRSYIEREGYRGYDPYDVLTSPLFRFPVLRSNKLVRFGSQQVFRRIPFNIRPLLGIRKGYNPVTLGLCVQAYSYLASVYSDVRSTCIERINFLIEELERLQSPGYHGACWGYDFDWQARYASLPAFTPTVVATGIITNGMYEAYRLLSVKKAFELCCSAAEFVRYDLNRSFEGEAFCFSYSPRDNQRVFNASMKGVRLLAQAYALSKNEQLLLETRGAVQFIIKHQRKNGSWAYAHGDARTWSDGYHTAYVLDCLQSYQELTNDGTITSCLDSGFRYYKTHFFEDGFIPKYYDTALYPLDATCIAQAILTFSRFDEMALAERICLWMRENFLDPRGFVYYQKHRLYTHRTSYMRWSNAWMFCALAYFLYRLKGQR